MIYSELDRYGIDGAKGNIENSTIIVPKSLENDDRFLHTPVRRLYQKHSYGIPSIDEFGATIYYQDVILDKKAFGNLLCNTFKIEEKFFRFITQKKKKRAVRVQEELFLNRCCKVLEANSPYKYELAHDTISKHNKELYLIKRRK